MSINTLLNEAKRCGIEKFALTDINNSMGMIDFVKKSVETGITPIAGIEFRNNDFVLEYVALARNNHGFHLLNEFLTQINLDEIQLTKRAPQLDDVYFIYPLQYNIDFQLLENEYIGVKPSQVNSLVNGPLEKFVNKMVILSPVTLASPKEYDLHLHLRAIDQNTLLTKVKPDIAASSNEVFFDPSHFYPIYQRYPQILVNTSKIWNECNIGFDFQHVKNKQTFTGDKNDDRNMLRELSFDGMKIRYGKHDTEAAKRIYHELEVIDNLGFCSYFLIAHDIIRYSMNRGIRHVGRGSGANSIVAYCLKISDIDPIELNLYFERFINPKRTNPPDFDIDYSWRDRPDIQQYIFNRYPKRHVALLGATTTFRDRSILRELGKVHGLPKEELDMLVRTRSDDSSQDSITRRLHSLRNQFIDFPNNRSIHAGGILISEKPITWHSALDLPPKGFPTTQWDMYVAEDLRYEKLDILSQRGIGHIYDAVKLVKQNQGIDIDIQQVDDFKSDPLINRRLYDGEVNGCFYVESPAMRGLLKKLRCDNYLTLVAASSIIRPGVAKSGMMREYIRRFHHPDDFEYLHPVMKEQLSETFGVMVYQEDVIKICHHFAGLDLSDADILRRAMAGKFRSKAEFARIHHRFFENCRQRGYSDKLASEVWRQIESFAGYSFSKAHSASYAIESYQSMYLKTYFPKEFMVAVINNFGGFYSTWVYFNEAKRSGAIVNLPCVNRSTYLTTIYGNDIYIGFVHLQNIETDFGHAIVKERELNGLYTSLTDFVNRLGAGLEQILILIRIDAFRFTGKGKPELLWEAHFLLGHRKQSKTPPSLFKLEEKPFKLPQLESTELEGAYDEIELLGFTVSMNMFDMLETKFRGNIFAKDLIKYVGKKIRILGNLVTIKNASTIKNELMHFGCFLDIHGEFFDTVHFPNSVKKYPFKGNGVYLILGEVTEEFEFPCITVEKMAKLPLKKDPRA